MAVSRRLVAVFAADVEGYSRLMGADEVGTLKGLINRTFPRKTDTDVRRGRQNALCFADLVFESTRLG
jgi:hypothetical protein